MIITYVQDDGSTEEVSTDDLSAIEAADVEQAMGETPWRQIEDLLRAQDPTAMRAVLWVFRRRGDKTLKFGEFDVPGWKRRLKARIERHEIDDALDSMLLEALGAGEDSAIDAMAPHLRRLAHDPADVDAALVALGKGHLAKAPADSTG
ncbi:hypothetical protein [Streptomyces sp. NPDC058045]|uniref:hypothetical protein n=1 Tax=Streptomyces sp. NPDC058045 TaxID=3346311 RepID=UPI0036E6A31A